MDGIRKITGGLLKQVLSVMTPSIESPITFCVSTCNNLNYLKLLVHSVRTHAHFKDAPFIVYAENCDKDETDKWLEENKDKHNLTVIIEHNKEAKGIGVGMNVTAARASTEYIFFLHADMFVSKDFDLKCLELFTKYPNDRLYVNPYRFQPNCFNEQDRPGTAFFSYDVFGYKADDFSESHFLSGAEFFQDCNPDIEVPKGEGVSGLIRKVDWDYTGGNDPQFIAYYDDMDLFLRMRQKGFKFIITTNAVVFHFGSRSDKSNFPDDTIQRSERSMQYEQQSRDKFLKKWGFLPVHDEYGFVDFPIGYYGLSH